MNSFSANFNKKKVIFKIGATGTGKSKLSIDLATRFPAEIINSDKIQVYKGLDIVTNKVPESERRGVPHHLLGEVEPDSDYAARDFCHEALAAIEKISRSGQVPIIIGGSNSYLEALVEGHFFKFKSKYDCCFIWLDVSLPVHFSYVAKRVDQMVDAGLIDEVRGIFDPVADYNKGIRRAIGVPEMDQYFPEEAKMDEKSKKDLLASAIEEIMSLLALAAAVLACPFLVRLTYREQLDSLTKLDLPVLTCCVPWASHSPLCSLHDGSSLGSSPNKKRSLPASDAVQAQGPLDVEVNGGSGASRDEIENMKEDGELPSLIPTGVSFIHTLPSGAEVSRITGSESLDSSSNGSRGFGSKLQIV